MVQLDDRVILGLAALAAGLYLYTLRTSATVSTSVGRSVSRGAGKVYGDVTSVPKTGYSDAKKVAKAVAKQGSGFKSWVKRRF